VTNSSYSIKVAQVYLLKGQPLYNSKITPKYTDLKVSLQVPVRLLISTDCMVGSTNG